MDSDPRFDNRIEMQGSAWAHQVGHGSRLFEAMLISSGHMAVLTYRRRIPSRSSPHRRDMGL